MSEAEHQPRMSHRCMRFDMGCEKGPAEDHVVIDEDHNVAGRGRYPQVSGRGGPITSFL